MTVRDTLFVDVSEGFVVRATAVHHFLTEEEITFKETIRRVHMWKELVCASKY